MATVFVEKRTDDDRHISPTHRRIRQTHGASSDNTLLYYIFGCPNSDFPTFHYKINVIRSLRIAR